MKLLGIDYGQKRIGLSIGESDVKIATIFGIIENKGEVVKEVCDMIKKEGIDRVIVGIPRSHEGQVTGIAREVKHFIQALIVSAGVPVITVNEYASSKEARSRMMNSDMGGNDDAIAAMIVLQSYLDSQS